MSMYLNCGGSGKKPSPKPDPCPQLPGTVLRVFIPAGAVINVLGIVEVTSPSGICFIIRLPFFDKIDKAHNGFGPLFDSIKQAGGTVEVVTQ